MTDPVASLPLGEPADEDAWRALVDKALKGASWDRLVTPTADGGAIQPLYREKDFPTGADPFGLPGAAPFVRGVAASRDPARPWLIRQTYEHPDLDRTNRDILEDLRGGVSSIELRLDWKHGARGVRVRSGADLDRVLADVIVEAAPIALDAGGHGLWLAELLAAKLKGAPGAGVAFNVDPIGAMLHAGGFRGDALLDAARFAARVAETMPDATALRVDARPVHEAGGLAAQEIAVALCSGIAYLRALTSAGLPIESAARALLFTLSVDGDVLNEAAKLRALRLCWARVLEASGAEPEARAARMHVVTSQRMMTRYDAWTNILRVTSAAMAAAIGGAEAITTLPFTDALGLPTSFARRVARNTQNVLIEEARLGHVIDPTGGAWFVEARTRALADAAWAAMQGIERRGGIVEARMEIARDVAAARWERQRAFDERRETITGVTDFPLLGAAMPEFEPDAAEKAPPLPALPPNDSSWGSLDAIRWASRFETIRDRAESVSPRPAVFFATLGPLADFSARGNFVRNLLGVGGIAAIAPEAVYASDEERVAAFRASGARVAVICGSDARYAAEGAQAARALRAAGCTWLAMAGMPADAEKSLSEAGVDYFIVREQSIVPTLTAVVTALGVPPGAFDA